MNNISMISTPLSGAGHYASSGKALRAVNAQRSICASDFKTSSRYCVTASTIANTTVSTLATPAITITSATDGTTAIDTTSAVGALHAMAASPRPQSVRQGSTVASRLRNTPRQAAVAGTARRVQAATPIRSHEPQEANRTPTRTTTLPGVQGEKALMHKTRNPLSTNRPARTPEQLEDDLFGSPPALSLDPPQQDFSALFTKDLTRADLLANSGVSAWTEYPLSASPRGSLEDIHFILTGRTTEANPVLRLEIGAPLPRQGRECHTTVRTAKINEGKGFAAVDYAAVEQPRTTRAREQDGEEVSPGTMPVGVQMSRKEREAEEAGRSPPRPPRSANAFGFRAGSRFHRGF